MKILLLEDDFSIRATLQFLLEWEGYEVVSFVQGDSALDFLRAAEVDVVLMDWNTPGKSGLAFLETLDEVCLPLFRPRVVILSGDHRAQAAIERKRAQTFLMKPAISEAMILGALQTA